MSFAGALSGGQPAVPAELSDRDRAILAFERQWWKYAGAKEQAIRDLFDMSATRYYQVLNALLDRPEALAALDSSAHPARHPVAVAERVDPRGRACRRPQQLDDLRPRARRRRRGRGQGVADRRDRQLPRSDRGVDALLRSGAARPRRVA